MARQSAGNTYACLSCGHGWLPKTDWEACPACFLTPKQAELNVLLTGPQRHTLLYGGARSGKTVLFVRAIMQRAIHAPNTRHAMLRLRANAARASLWLDTIPKVNKIWYPQFTLKDHRQDGYVEIVESGSQIWIAGTDDKQRVEKILGQEFLTLYFNECSQIPYPTVVLILTRLAQTHPEVLQRAYYDLNPVGTGHYTAQLFIRGRDPLTLRSIADADNRRYAFINPKDNRAYLSQDFLDSLQAMPERQRKRFYEGVYQAEIDGALWTFESIEAARCAVDDVPATMRKVVVAIDPSGTRGDEDERSDEVGIIVAGLASDGNAYVLADRTCSLPPEGWAKVAVTAYREFRADRIVAEQNYGGDMVRATIHARDRNVPVELVTASRGKAVRAEPVSALYGRDVDGVWTGGIIKHAGNFVKLEDQMLNFSTAGYMGDRSPDRADALVWAITDLLLNEMKGYGLFEHYRRMAEQRKAEESGEPIPEPPPPPDPPAGEPQIVKPRSLEEVYEEMTRRIESGEFSRILPS
jgi:phage terminase large subunit-like protein